MKKFIIITLSFIAGLALFVYTLQKFGWQKIVSNLTILSWQQFLIVLVLMLAGFIIAVFRLRTVLRSQAQEEISFLTILKAKTVEYALSYLTPVANFGGEIMGVIYLNEESSIRSSINIFSVVVDKAIDMTIGAMLMLIGLVYILFNFKLPMGVNLAILSVLIFWLGLGYFFYSRALKNKGFFTSLINLFWLHQIEHINKFTGSIQEVEKLISDFFIHKPRYLIQAIILSLISKCFQISALWLIIYFLKVHISVFQVLGFMSLLSVAFFSPIPAGLGIGETLEALGFNLFGFGGHNGIAFILILRAYQLTGVLIGLMILFFFQIKTWKKKALEKLKGLGERLDKLISEE